jgi:hypothetical protein
MEGFHLNLADTFTSIRGCAESMLCIGQPKVKITVKGQISIKQILDFMLCLLETLIIMEGFLQIWLTHSPHPEMCRAHVPLKSVHGQGHS